MGGIGQFGKFPVTAYSLHSSSDSVDFSAAIVLYNHDGVHHVISHLVINSAAPQTEHKAPGFQCLISRTKGKAA